MAEENPVAEKRGGNRWVRIIAATVLVLVTVSALLFAKGPNLTHPSFLGGLPYKDQGWKELEDGTTSQWFYVDRPLKDVQAIVNAKLGKRPGWMAMGAVFFVKGRLSGAPSDQVAVLLLGGYVKDVGLPSMGPSDEKQCTVVIAYGPKFTQLDRMKLWLTREL